MITSRSTLNTLVTSLLSVSLLALTSCQDTGTDTPAATETPYSVMQVTSGSATFGSAYGNFDPYERAQNEALLYDRFIQYHIPFGQAWVRSFRTEGNKSKGCSCVESEATSSSPFCGNLDLVVKDDAPDTSSRTGDGAGFTGHALAMTAYKLAATQDARVLADLKTILTAVETLFAVTGNKGELARAFVPPGNDNQRLDGDEKHLHTVTTGPLKDYRWSGDISRDQYAGIMFGLWAAWTLVEDTSVRTRIAKLVKDFVEVLLDNGYRLPRGDRLTDLSFDPGVAESGHAIYLISYVLMAQIMTGNSKFSEKYTDITTDDGLFDIPAIQIAENWGKDDPTLSSKCHFRSKDGNSNKDTYYRFNIIAPEIYMLNAMSSVGGHSSTWQSIANTFWKGHSGALVKWNGVQKDKNALFDILYAVSANGGSFDHRKSVPYSGSVPPLDATQDAIKQLGLFPAGPVRKNLKINSQIAEKSGCVGTAEEALDLDVRPPFDYAWEKSPATLDNPCHQPWIEKTGVDYLLSYWMLRYYGYFRTPSIELAQAQFKHYGDAGLTASAKVTLKDWIPESAWELRTFSVALYSGSTLIKQKSVSVGADPLTWINTKGTLELEVDPAEITRGNTYRLKVSATLWNVPGEKFPSTTSVPIRATSDEFTYAKISADIVNAKEAEIGEPELKNPFSDDSDTERSPLDELDGGK